MLALITIVGIALLGIGAGAFASANQGADFSVVFNEPARSASADHQISWSPGESLLRQVEPQTAQAIEFAWVRAGQAVDNAATESDLHGVDVWFSGPAKEQLLEQLATGAFLDGGRWTSHEITPNFYSIDGQILMAHIERAAQSDLESASETVRVVFILRDGNWRVEHLTRVS